MNTSLTHLSRSLCVLVLFSALLGCARSPETSYYVLDSHQQIVSEAPVQKASLHVRRVDIPSYLDRNSIVTRPANSVQVTLAEFHQWAESLSCGMQRVLAEVLAPRLAMKSVALVPLDDHSSKPLQVFIQVLRFDGTLGAEALLEARWTVRTPDDAIVAQGGFRDHVPAGATYESLVKAQSALLIRFGESLVDPLSKASLAFTK